VLKLKGKHFIDPKRSEILSVFQVFPCTTQIALFLAHTAHKTIHVGNGTPLSNLTDEVSGKV
jgi:hypothetical protein